MTSLEGCIKFWEEKLLYSRFLLEPSTTVLIEMTIKYLKELQVREERDGTKLQ